MVAGRNTTLVEKRLEKALTALYSLGEAHNCGTVPRKTSIIIELRRCVDAIEAKWNKPTKRTPTGRAALRQDQYE